jgi:molybdate transport system regulatory protein
MELKWRFWFEEEGNHVMGKGGAEILKAIKEYGSISSAAKSLGMSYRFVWKYLKRMEETLGSAAVEKERGGKLGGGTKLTLLGESLLRQYTEVERYLKDASERIKNLKRLEIEVKGIVSRIDVDGLVEIKIPALIRAFATNDVANELKEGDEITIKAIEVKLRKRSNFHQIKF